MRATTSPRKLKGSGKAQRITRAPLKAALVETGPAGNELLWLGLVLLATCVAYLPLFKTTFLNYDDDIYVTENPFVRNLDIENLKVLFSTIYQNQYAPVAMFVMALECKILGATPVALKAVSLFLHLANVLLVFYLVRRLFERFDYALLTAGLFAVHPIQVEAVAWLAASMKIGLYSLFFLGALVAYLQYLKHTSLRWLGLSLVLFAMSCLSKEQAIVLPAALFGIDYALGRKMTSRSLVFEKIPFLIVAIIIAFATLALTNKPQNEDAPVSYPFIERVIFASYSTAASVVRLILPVRLCAFYTHPVGDSIPLRYYASPFLAVLFSAGLWFFWKSKRRIPVFAIVFFLANISLPFMSQLLSVRDVSMADRYMYLPAISCFLMGGWALGEWIKKKPQLRAAVWGTLVCYAVVLTVLTWQRTKVWENSITLFSDVIEKEKATPGTATSFLALAYNNRGVARKRLGDRAGALEDFNRGIAVSPNDPRLWLSRANLQFDAGQFETAIQGYDKVLQWDHKNASAYSNRGAAYGAQNRFDLGEQDLNRAIELDPTLADAFGNRALLYAGAKRYAEELADIDRYLRLKPGDVEMMNMRALALIDLNRLPEAESEFDRAIQISPGTGAIYLNRSHLYQRTGRKTQALDDAQRAQSLGVKVDPQYLNSLH